MTPDRVGEVSQADQVSQADRFRMDPSCPYDQITVHGHLGAWPCASVQDRSAGLTKSTELTLPGGRWLARALLA